MSIIKNFLNISQTIYDVVDDYQRNGIDYFGFDYPKKMTNGKEWKFTGIDCGKINVRINTASNILYINIFEDYLDNALIDIGIPIEKINSKEDIIEAVKEELDLVLTHYEMMMDELEE